MDPENAGEDGEYRDIELEDYLASEARRLGYGTTAQRPTAGGGGDRYFATDTEIDYLWTGSAWVPEKYMGAWTAYTPTIDQGVTTNITKTVTQSEYKQEGSTLTWQFYIVVTGAGTAGSIVTLTLPVAAAAGAAEVKAAGNGQIFDSSAATRYGMELETSASGTVLLYAGDSTGSNGWGGVPSIALANNDQLRGLAVYQVAT
jgi:hypothetical protein